MERLKDKVALVTGGSRGIGAAVARRLALEGAAVAITYAESADSADAVVAAIEVDRGRALAIQADSGDVDAVKAAVATVMKRFGRLDVLVNNAAAVRFGSIADYSLEDLDRMIAVNIKGLFVATQEAVRHMGEGGRVINIGSISSEFMPIAGGSVYAMTKAAVAGLTHGLARDLGPRGITVNNVQPGPTDTDMNAGIIDMLSARSPLKRVADPAEIAGVVSYLAGSGSSYMTGASLTIDGGLTL